jgi:peroxiredoxin
MAYGAADSSKAGFAKRITYVIGPDGKIAQAWPQVDPKSHPRAILDGLPG